MICTAEVRFDHITWFPSRNDIAGEDLSPGLDLIGRLEALASGPRSGDLAAAGACDGGRERGQRRLEEREERVDDEEVSVHGAHQRELGERGGRCREVGHGRGGGRPAP